MPETVYRQQFIAATYNGVPLQGLMDSGSIRVITRGGELELTEGTDGGDVNIATLQGMQVEVDLRETSTVHEFLFEQNRSQANGGPGATLVLYTGTGRSLSCGDMYVSVPGELTTGDKVQGAHTYTFLAKNFSFY